MVDYTQLAFASQIEDCQKLRYANQVLVNLILFGLICGILAYRSTVISQFW